MGLVLDYNDVSKNFNYSHTPQLFASSFLLWVILLLTRVWIQIYIEREKCGCKCYCPSALLVIRGVFYFNVDFEAHPSACLNLHWHLEWNFVLNAAGFMSVKLESPESQCNPAKHGHSGSMAAAFAYACYRGVQTCCNERKVAGKE